MAAAGDGRADAFERGVLWRAVSPLGGVSAAADQPDPGGVELAGGGRDRFRAGDGTVCVFGGERADRYQVGRVFRVAGAGRVDCGRNWPGAAVFRIDSPAGQCVPADAAIYSRANAAARLSPAGERNWHAPAARGRPDGPGIGADEPVALSVCLGARISRFATADGRGDSFREPVSVVRRAGTPLD